MKISAKTLGFAIATVVGTSLVHDAEVSAVDVALRLLFSPSAERGSARLVSRGDRCALVVLVAALSMPCR
jgi:hypothetical protein